MCSVNSRIGRIKRFSNIFLEQVLFHLTDGLGCPSSASPHSCFQVIEFSRKGVLTIARNGTELSNHCAASGRNQSVSLLLRRGQERKPKSATHPALSSSQYLFRPHCHEHGTTVKS